MEDTPQYAKSPTMNDTANAIKLALEVETDIHNPVEMMEKIKELSLLTASAAALQANAKKKVLEKECELLKEYQKTSIAPSILMRLITAECSEEVAWLTYAERLNAGMTHALDGLRSSLSFLKSEMETTRNI